MSDPGQLQVTHSKLKQAQIRDPDSGTKSSSYITSSGHVTVARTIPCQTGKWFLCEQTFHLSHKMIGFFLCKNLEHSSVDYL